MVWPLHVGPEFSTVTVRFRKPSSSFRRLVSSSLFDTSLLNTQQTKQISCTSRGVRASLACLANVQDLRATSPRSAVLSRMMPQLALHDMSSMKHESRLLRQEIGALMCRESGEMSGASTIRRIRAAQTIAACLNACSRRLPKQCAHKHCFALCGRTPVGGGAHTAVS